MCERNINIHLYDRRHLHQRRRLSGVPCGCMHILMLSKGFPGNAFFESLLGNRIESLAHESPSWISFGVVAKPLSIQFEISK